ncbi:MAG: TRAP transporter large permease subunit, partial [Rhodospirillaceae bacterium]|nr:TRAP transporter large permease subunit [Rhodospirillaceae bacterium]
GLSSLDIIMIVAGAGFIIGTLHITGLGFALTVMLVDFGGGSLFLLLVIAAVLCIILGMGMPTAGVYILLAVLIAPSLARVGIDPLAAHMFILYSRHDVADHAAGRGRGLFRGEHRRGAGDEDRLDLGAFRLDRFRGAVPVRLLAEPAAPG